MAKKRKISYTSSDESDEFMEHQPATRKTSTTKKRKTAGTTQPRDAVHTTPTTVAHEASLHIIKDVGPARKALLIWYADVSESRGMPWRKAWDLSFTPDQRSQRAYEVWVSEIMLQQTQVATVIPYYQKWMETFPSLSALAASDVPTVHGLWKGLGYYSRATRLLSGAQKAMKDHDGRLPNNAQEMEKHIPGIGRYSAGAISSIAYGEAAPILDGNVHRLMSRILALHAPPKAKATLDLLWEAATAMVRDEKDEDQNPGDINQALIELGSTVCKVKEPLCETCPMKPWCSAYITSKAKEAPTQDIEDLCTLCEPFAEGSVSPASYPMKIRRRKVREELDLVNVVEWRESSGQRWFLLVKRPSTGLLAGLHEFPTSSNVPFEASHRTSAANVVAALLRHPVSIKEMTTAGDVAHLFSHIKKTYRAQWVLLEGGDTLPELRDLKEAVPVKSKKNRKTSKAKSKAKAKRKEKQDTAAEEDSAEEIEVMDTVGVAVKWVKMDEVESANIGTGVLKVWNLVKSLWRTRSLTN